jgi:hypothetical protein
MRNRVKAVAVVIAIAAAAIVGFCGVDSPVSGQTPSAAGFAPYRPPRTADGRPDLNGIWQAFTTANWDILDHEAQPGPHPEILGAYGAGPGGQSIVEGNELPYQPWAAEKQKENLKNRMRADSVADATRYDTGDPELKCYRPGVPRATYMPFPFQIFQAKDQILIVYEFKSAVRTIYMDGKHPEGPGDFWMGWSTGRWEGDTLVVDVKQFNEYTWFDRVGNFHSDEMHVVERYTPVSPYHLRYEATIEDPKVFTRPWKMSFPIYRRVERNVQLMGFNCVPFVEDLLYDSLDVK